MEGSLGIDVSRYQGEIDWQTVKNAGIEFAMIKALQGSKKIDPCFARNASGAQKAGVPFGIYVYSKAKSKEDALAEARAAVALAGEYELLYPIAIDVESAHLRLMESADLAGIINIFCAEVKASGYLPLIYSNKDWLLNVIPKECSAKWDVWLAQWRKSDPDYPGPFTMWQYGKGEVPGVENKADMDICLVDYPSLIASARPLSFAVTIPYLRGEGYAAMQRALNAANYRDSNGDPLETDGIWGPKSMSAMNRLIDAQKKKP